MTEGLRQEDVLYLVDRARAQGRSDGAAVALLSAAIAVVLLRSTDGNADQAADMAGLVAETLHDEMRQQSKTWHQLEALRREMADPGSTQRGRRR